MRRGQDKSGPKLRAEFKSPSITDFSNSAVPQDFTFIVEKQIYKCKAAQLCPVSEVISNRINSVIFLSPTKTEYTNSEIRDSDNSFFEGFFYNFNSKQNNKPYCEKLKDPHHYFQVFLDSIAGNEIIIDKFNAFFLNYVATVLDIKPLITATEPFMATIQPHNLNCTNCVQILGYFSQHNIRREEVVKFVVDNWRELDCSFETLICYTSHATNDENDYDPDELRKLKKLIKMPYEFFEFVFSHPSFKPRVLQWMPWFVYLLITTNSQNPETPNPDFIKLLKYCDFKKAPSYLVDQIISTISYDEIPFDFIQTIEPLFCSKVDPQTKIKSLKTDKVLQLLKNSKIENEKKKNSKETAPRSQPKPTEIPAQTVPQQPSKQPVSKSSGIIELPFTPICNQNFNGIFSYFISQKKLRSSVKVFGGGNKESMLQHLFEYDSKMFEYYWDSYSRIDLSSLKNAWLVFSFKSYRVKLDHYSLATSPFMQRKDCPGIQPISWRIEGFDDYIEKVADIKSDTNWEKVALEIKNHALVKNGDVVETFRAVHSTKAYRTFKFTMMENKEKTKDYANQLKLNAIEFYGKLIPISS